MDFRGRQQLGNHGARTGVARIRERGAIRKPAVAAILRRGRNPKRLKRGYAATKVVRTGYSPPLRALRGGVAAPLRRCREASRTPKLLCWRPFRKVVGASRMR